MEVSNTTETTIAGTKYIVESISSKTATETALLKIKRLILNNSRCTNSTK